MKRAGGHPRPAAGRRPGHLRSILSVTLRPVISDLLSILLRDLDTVRREVELYPDDETLWRELAGLPNTGGTLVLHLAGNLRHFIGATLGHSGFVRDRESEFSSRGLSREQIVAQVDATRAEVAAAFGRLSSADLERPFPLQVGGVGLSTGRFVLHVMAHLAYHLGQLDYHRRVATGDAASAGAMSFAPLAARSTGHAS